MLNELPFISSWIEDEWKYHLENDFEALEAIPCGAIRGYCAMFSAVEDYRDIEFLMKFSKREISEEENHKLFLSQQEYKRKSIDNEPISHLKAALTNYLKNDPESEASGYIKEFLETVKNLETPKAKDIRAAMKPLLKEKYGVSLKSTGGGLWECILGSDDVPIRLSIDFGGFSQGFRYSLYFPHKDVNKRSIDTSYESLLGFFYNPMDLLRTDILKEQLEYIFKNIDKVVLLILQYNKSLQPTAGSGG